MVEVPPYLSQVVPSCETSGLKVRGEGEGLARVGKGVTRQGLLVQKEAKGASSFDCQSKTTRWGASDVFEKVHTKGSRGDNGRCKTIGSGGGCTNMVCFKGVQGEATTRSEGLGFEELKGAHILNGIFSEEAWCCKGLLEKEVVSFLKNGLCGLGWVLLGQEAL